MDIARVQPDPFSKKREKSLTVLAITFAGIAWIVLLPTLYVANLWLLPLHEITAWSQQQVRILEGFGWQVDIWSFRSFVSSWSSLAPCVTFLIFSMSVFTGWRAHRVFKIQGNNPKPGKLLITALVLGNMGILTTGSVFSVSLIYLVLYWLMRGL